MSRTNRALEKLKQEWTAVWPESLAAWSRYTRLTDPRWCFLESDEKREGLSGSFAMIRLEDHAVVISLRQVRKMKLGAYAKEIMAHEVGHHVYCPADLTDHARMIAHMRRSLPTFEQHAAFVANLYTDLLINDRLQRSMNLDMAGVYKTMGSGSGNPMWVFYMRICEILWRLPKGSLATGEIDDVLEGDAQLGARVVRAYSRYWLDGSGRFAALCMSYISQEFHVELVKIMRGWLDTKDAGAGGSTAGLIEIDEGEIDGAIHPSEDVDLTKLGETERGEASSKRSTRINRNRKGGIKEHKTFRTPMEYGEILDAAGIKLNEAEVAMRYYRERALPYLVRFPTRETLHSSDPLPEGLEPWDAGMDVHEVDWFESIIRSPRVIPGVTTVKRDWGTTRGGDPEREPLDLYVGIDCSGSMANPRLQVSYPALASVIVALSALRVGARVMACLSGEPGRTISTNDFVADESKVLGILTDYLGTGYGFGIHHLRPVFENRSPAARPAHILIVSDNDLFNMLDDRQQRQFGWQVALDALQRARGGGTCVLNISPGAYAEERKRLEDQGWNVHIVTGWEDLVVFAGAFSKAKFGSLSG